MEEVEGETLKILQMEVIMSRKQTGSEGRLERRKGVNMSKEGWQLVPGRWTLVQKRTLFVRKTPARKIGLTGCKCPINGIGCTNANKEEENGESEGD